MPAVETLRDPPWHGVGSLTNTLETPGWNMLKHVVHCGPNGLVKGLDF